MASKVAIKDAVPPGKKKDEGISILENPELIKDLKRKKGGFGEALRELRLSCCFFVFVTLFSYIVLTESFADYWGFEDALRIQFNNPPRSLQLNQVNSMDNLWNYLNGTVWDNFYMDPAEHNKTMDSMKLDMNFNNLVIGKVRIRSLRVKPNENCQLRSEYKHKYNECYGPYSRSVEERQAYGPNGEHLHKMSGPFPTNYAGQLAEYSPDGYMYTWSGSSWNTHLLFKLFKQTNYFDIQTRAVFIDFNVWNTNNQFLGITKIVFEIPPAGKWRNKMNFVVITERYLTASFDRTLLAEFFMILLVAYYIAQELSEFTISKSEYLQDGWNIVDWANLILLLYYIVLRIWCLVGAPGNVFKVLADEEGPFVDMSEFAYYISEMRAVNAFNAILIWTKTMKYVSFIPYVTLVMATIRYSWKLFVSFTVIAGCTFIGFAIGFTGGFGDKFEEVNSFAKACVFLAQSFVGSADFSDVMRTSPFFGAVLIILLIVLVYLVMLNLFMAVMVVALSGAKAQQMDSMENAGAWGRRVKAWKLSIARALELNQKMEKYTPGLFARTQMRKAEHDEILRRRQERKDTLEMRRRMALGLPLDVDDDDDDGGPESPNAGRTLVSKKGKGVEERFTEMGNATDLPRPKRERDDIVESGSEDSEIDIGILSNSKVKQRKKKMAQGGLTESEVILSSVQHIAATLARRSETVKDIMLDEMKEVKMICSVVSDVLDILSRRGTDLAKQQRTFIDSLGF